MKELFAELIMAFEVTDEAYEQIKDSRDENGSTIIIDDVYLQELVREGKASIRGSAYVPAWAFEIIETGGY